MTGIQSVSRREFGRVVAFGTAAALLSPARAPARDERFWAAVRDQFPLDPDLVMMNAANLCPSSLPVLHALDRHTRHVDRDPSFENRAVFASGREETRRLLAQFLNVSAEEIVITRNTSESNNLVSNGIDLGEGDEVLIFSDNHPSNHKAWTEKARRFGFGVRVVEQVNPHPGADYYLDAFRRAITPATRVLAFTHLTNTSGDLLPAAGLCRMARERGILTLVDGAQSFGLLEVDLAEMEPDFYTGSAHKWPCGPKETGVLYVRRDAQARFHPTIYSAYPGEVGISRTCEAFGQRDEPAILAFGEAIRLQQRVGRAAIEARARELAQALVEGLGKIEGVRLWTHPAPERSAAVVTFQPGGLDGRKLATALYEKHRIACAPRSGRDRPGIRLSPHLYNSHADVERCLSAVRNYLAHGL